jgi:hypothetical protein
LLIADTHFSSPKVSATMVGRGRVLSNWSNIRCHSSTSTSDPGKSTWEAVPPRSDRVVALHEPHQIPLLQEEASQAPMILRLEQQRTRLLAPRIPKANRVAAGDSSAGGSALDRMLAELPPGGRHMK